MVTKKIKVATEKDLTPLYFKNFKSRVHLFNVKRTHNSVSEGEEAAFV